METPTPENATHLKNRDLTETMVSIVMQFTVNVIIKICFVIVVWSAITAETNFKLFISWTIIVLYIIADSFWTVYRERGKSR